MPFAYEFNWGKLELILVNNTQTTYWARWLIHVACMFSAVECFANQ